MAAVGVATASFVAGQGCSSRPRYETSTSGNLLPPPHDAGQGVTGEGDAGATAEPGKDRGSAAPVAPGQ